MDFFSTTIGVINMSRLVVLPAMGLLCSLDPTGVSAPASVLHSDSDICSEKKHGGSLLIVPIALTSDSLMDLSLAEIVFIRRRLFSSFSS